MWPFYNSCFNRSQWKTQREAVNLSELEVAPSTWHRGICRCLTSSRRDNYVWNCWHWRGDHSPSATWWYSCRHPIKEKTKVGWGKNSKQKLGEVKLQRRAEVHPPCLQLGCGDISWCWPTHDGAHLSLKWPSVAWFIVTLVSSPVSHSYFRISVRISQFGVCFKLVQDSCQGTENLTGIF